MFWRFALSDVWINVTQPLLMFQTMFGIKTNKKIKKENSHLKIFFFRLVSNFLSTKLKIKKLNKKYTAAYLAIKAKPKKSPNKIKFINDAFILVSKSFVIDNNQNNISRRSVEIKKDETLAAGISKKLEEQTIEAFFDKLNCKQNL